MVDFVKLNGTAVRVTSLRRHPVTLADGSSGEEFRLVAIMRGTAAHRSFLDLTTAGPLRLEIPTDDGWEQFTTVVADASQTSSGTGPSAAFRHDLTLRLDPTATPQTDAETTTTATTTTAPAAELDPALLSLRVEAVIEALDTVGVVRRANVDEIYRRLVAEHGGARSEDKPATGP